MDSPNKQEPPHVKNVTLPNGNNDELYKALEQARITLHATDKLPPDGWELVQRSKPGKPMKRVLIEGDAS